MLERRKDDSESLGKYQGMLVSTIIAALIIFLAPSMIIMLTDCQKIDPNSGNKTGIVCDESDLFTPPGKTFANAVENLKEMWNLLM